MQQLLPRFRINENNGLRLINPVITNNPIETLHVKSSFNKSKVPSRYHLFMILSRTSKLHNMRFILFIYIQKTLEYEGLRLTLGLLDKL